MAMAVVELMVVVVVKLMVAVVMLNSVQIPASF
jgi:hypothetical protein